MSLYPWRPACGCLIDEVDGEPQVLEWCGRHDGCRLVVVEAAAPGSYPPVTKTGVEAFSGSPAPTPHPDWARAGERPLPPSQGKDGAGTGRR